MKTVDVRIAVCVDERGEWVACAFKGEDERNRVSASLDCMARAPDDNPDYLRHVVWVTAKVPLPEMPITTIPGAVEPIERTT